MPTPLSITHQLFIDGAWTTYPAYAEDGWSYTVGPDVDSGSKPNKLSCTFQNPTLTMDPSRPDSPLYGKAGTNTPVRFNINAAGAIYAEASDWQPDRTIDHTVSPARGRAHVDMNAGGLLRRLSLWSEPIKSAMARQIGGYTANGMTGYSRLEDKSGVTNLTQDVAGVRPGSYTGGVVLAGDPGPGGSDSTVSLGSDGTITTYFNNPGGSGYQLCFAVKLSAAPSAATYQQLCQWVDSRGRIWTVSCSNANYQYQVTEQDGTVLLAATSVSYGTNLNRWMRLRMRVTVSGSTFTWEPSWYVQDGSFITGTTLTFTGGTTTGQPRSFTATAAGASYLSNASFGHVFSITDTALVLDNSGPALAAFDGYMGEQALSRWLRLLNEAGLPRFNIGSSAGTGLMGRQKPGLLLDLLEECCVTDGGFMYDEPLQIGLTYITRQSLAAKVPVFTLTRDQIVAPFRRRLTDAGKANVITANNASGDKVTVRLDTGRLSTKPPPNGIGEVRASIDVNLADPGVDLANRAALELNRLTIDRVRYDNVTINLHDKITIQNLVTNMRPGDLIAITGEEPDTLILRVMNWTRSGGAITDTVTFSCIPSEVDQVAVIDAANARIDSSSSTLNAAITSTATTFVITTYDPVEVWSLTAGAFDMMIAGERIGIPAGGISAVTGTGPYLQTVTGAVRSKNGVVKAQLIATPVNIADPRRIF